MFTGRTREIESLEKAYKTDKFQFAVLYGRRRVGKTTLIHEFIKDKQSIYYMAIEGTARDNLNSLSSAVMNMGGRVSGISASFESFMALLDYIDEIVSSERMVFVIDEYPYLAASYPALSSLIQQHIDLKWKNSRLFLILCGSSMSFMENQVLGYKSPLYGRRTMQLKLKPFTFFEAHRMLPERTPEEAAVIYGITGGIPAYLERLDCDLSVDDNISSLFYTDTGILYEEPVNLLKQELRDPASYHSIISAIAGGASRLNEISARAGLESSGCSNQLQSLISLGIVSKEVPINEKATSRKTLYRLEDGMFRFWFGYVRPYLGAISMGYGKAVYYNLVKTHLSEFMGRTFEDICRQYLYEPEVFSKMPFIIERAGRWWGNNPFEHRQEEIDIAAAGNDSILLCECKWRNEASGIDTGKTLIERGRLFDHLNKYYWIFSKSGFTGSLAAYAEEYGIRLTSLHDMLLESPASFL